MNRVNGKNSTSEIFNLLTFMQPYQEAYWYYIHEEIEIPQYLSRITELRFWLSIQQAKNAEMSQELPIITELCFWFSIQQAINLSNVVHPDHDACCYYIHVGIKISCKCL